MRLILASGSPRRAELLRAAGIEFDAIRAEVDESVLAGETPKEHVARLAEAKARAVLTRADHRPVLSADTVVVVGGAILGKPADEAEARRMLRMLSGRSHEVVTGVCLVAGGRSKGERAEGGERAEAGQGAKREERTQGGRLKTMTETATTTVEFAPLTDAEVEWYVASGEPADKAGAYAIQGFASRFVTRVDGSYSNVVGLPVALVYQLCKRAGLLIF